MNTGAITVAGKLDYGSTASYSLTVQVDDGNNGTASATVNVAVTGVAENAPPAFGSSAYAFSIAEDAATGAAVGTVSANDADNDTLAYSITAGNGDGRLAINGSSRTIAVAGALDHETTPSYSLTVQADDGNGGTATTTVNITVTDVAEGPDGDDTKAGATVLDSAEAVDDPQYYHDKSLDRATGDRVDYYTFTTTARYEIGLGVRDQSIDLDATLEDADGNLVIKSWPPQNSPDIEWLKTVIEPGTYYIRVEAVEDGQTGYYVRFGPKAPQE